MCTYITQHTLKRNLYDRKTRKGMCLNIYIEDDLIKVYRKQEFRIGMDFSFW